MYSVGLCTLGCKVSQYETVAIGESFQKNGFTLSDFDTECDVYVINTCTVTAESDRKSRQMIRRAIQRNPEAIVMVCGCYAQTSGEDIGKIKGVSYVCGTDGKMKLADKAAELIRQAPRGCEMALASLEGASFEPMCIHSAPRTRAYVKIEDGCECRCTYCAIPNARGNVRSKNPRDVIDEVNLLSLSGTREIVLTGIETASYGVDLGSYRLIDLLEDIERECDVTRIRLGSLTPELMRDGFIDRLAALKRIAPHFHLSMQSGSSTVLARMKRRYNAEMAEKSMEKLRSAMPSVMFTTDIMVGFPGEDEREFIESLRFCERARFLDMHVFAFSKRKNTPAEHFDAQVEESVKRERSARMMAMRDRVTDEILTDLVKERRQMSAVFETQSNGMWIGHSAEFVKVAVKSERDIHSQCLDVVPTAVAGKTLICDMLNK